MKFVTENHMYLTHVYMMVMDELYEQLPHAKFIYLVVFGLLKFYACKKACTVESISLLRKISLHLINLQNHFASFLEISTDVIPLQSSRNGNSEIM